MESRTHFRVRRPGNLTRVGRLVLASWALTLTLLSAAEITRHYLQMSSLLLGCSTGAVVGCITYYVVDGTTIRRLSVGLLGLISSTTVVIDVTGQFFVFDGFAHLTGMVGLILALCVLLHTILGADEPTTGIRYFFVGLVCVGVATTGLALEWVLGPGAVSGIARPQQGLLLFSGLGVLIVGLRVSDDADSAVPQD